MNKGFDVFFLMLPLALIGCTEKSVTYTEPLHCPDFPVTHSGEATFYFPRYASDSTGSCSFDLSPGDTLIGAMNLIDYENSKLCGAVISVSGPRGTVVIKIVDLCPECPQGNIDLSPQAFAQIADTVLGRVPIHWHVLAADVSGPILYHFKSGSSQWWTAVQVRNHRYPIYSLEYLTPRHMFKAVSRTSYNYFVENNGMGPGPYTFRITDIYGHTLVDSTIVFDTTNDVAGHGQFPPCGQ
ncbi:MAG: hypothetical protein KGJ59_02025 [Bacteroidota bacterium]|nr:hypothetical protein [Bacteroidota bacterium]